MTSAADLATYIAGFPFFPRRPPVDPPCGTPDGVGTDALAPAMRITCPECVEAGDAFREGDCWLCTHRVLGSLCGRCGCLAHYPPWPDVAAPHSDPSAAS